MAAAHEHQGGGAVGERRAQPGKLGRDRVREQLDPAAAGLQHAREPGPQRAEVDAVRRLPQIVERQVVRAGAQHQVEAPFGAGAAGQPAGQLPRVAAVER